MNSAASFARSSFKKLEILFTRSRPPNASNTWSGPQRTEATLPEQVTVPLRGTREVGLRVVDVDEPRRIVTEGDLALLLPRMEMEFCDAAAGSCVIHWRMFSRVQSAWLSRSTIPLAGLLMRRRARVGLRTLKARLEAHAQIP